MGIKDSAKGISAALKLDSHHAIQRFGVFFGISALSFVFLFGGAGVSSLANQAALMDQTTLYTSSFSTSKTQVGGSVHGVYVNSDRTRAMVLMQFKDASAMSANAEKYQAFLTGSTRELAEQPLKTKMTGEIVTFGSTGYLAMVLDSDEPFQQQIVNLTMRSNSELVYKASDSRKVRKDLEGQTTFSKFDQWRLYFNPGASGATVTTALDAETFDAAGIYAELIVGPEEEKLRADMDEQLLQMQVDQARIAEYQAEAARLSVDDIAMVLPEIPEQIAGDKITGDPALDEESATLTLEADWVSPNGYDFDWREGSVESGYLDDLLDSDESYVTFLADKAASSREADNSLRVNDIEWALTNGRLLTDYGNSDRAMQPLFEVRNGLTKAFQDYYKHKVAYQAGSLGQLIELEVDLLGVRAGISVNDDEQALFTY